MPPVARRLHGYAIAVALTLATVAGMRVLDAATGLRLVLDPYMVPIALSAYLGGTGPGILAIVLSGVLSAGLFPDDLLNRNAIIDWAGLLLGGGFVVLLLDRARSARSLAEARDARFTTIAATAMDGIVTLDEAQRVTSFNDAAERMFGIAATEILGQRLDRLLPDGMVEEHARHVEEFGRSGVTRRQLGGAAVHGRRVTGELFPIDLSISQAVIDGQKVYTGILRDVTERVRAERALRETASQLKLFIENAPASIAMFDRDMRYLFASRAGSPTFASRGRTSSDAATTRSSRRCPRDGARSTAAASRARSRSARRTASRARTAPSTGSHGRCVRGTTPRGGSAASS